MVSPQESQLISVYNTGTAPATNLLVNMTGDNPGNVMTYTTDGVNSPCGATLAPAATCFVKAVFGPTKQSASKSLIHTSLNFNYTPGVNQDVSTSVVNLHGSIISDNSANLVATVISNTFESGTGSLSSSLLVEQDKTPLPTVTYKVTNVATVAGAIAAKVTANLSNPE